MDRGEGDKKLLLSSVVDRYPVGTNGFRETNLEEIIAIILARDDAKLVMMKVE